MGDLLLSMDSLESNGSGSQNALHWLHQRAGDHREDPWLFFTRGLRWRWRSFLQVADHVARASSSLQNAVSAPHLSAGVAFRGRCCPDSITLSLAIQTIGGAAVSRSAPDLAAPPPGREGPCPIWAEVEGRKEQAGLPEGCQKVVVPAVRSLLESWVEEVLPESDGGSVAGSGRHGGEPGEGKKSFSSREIAMAAQALENIVGPVVAPGLRRGQRPVVLIGPSADTLQAEIFVAWTLLRGAALVLEPQSDAVAATALWARPHLVLASSSALERLAQLLGQRFHLTHHRLRALINTDLEASSAVARLRWEAASVPMFRWPDASSLCAVR